MKAAKHLRSALIATAVISMTLAVRAEDNFFAVGRDKAVIPQKQNSTGDYLIEMARSAKLNVFADATNFPQTAPPLAGDWNTPQPKAKAGRWEGAVGQMLSEVANERKLTFRYGGARTFLFWSEPDAVELARELVAQESKKSATAGQLRYKKVDELIKDKDEVSFALLDYFKTAHHWDGMNGTPPPDVPFSALPEALRARLASYALRQTYNPPLIEERAWFNDAIWKNALLQVRRPLAGNPYPELIIGGVARRYGKATPVFRDVAVLK